MKVIKFGQNSRAKCWYCGTTFKFTSNDVYTTYCCANVVTCPGCGLELKVEELLRYSYEARRKD